MKFYKPNPKYLEYICSFDKNIIKNRNTIYFITNQQTKGITEYFLMNKNKKIAKINLIMKTKLSLIL